MVKNNNIKSIQDNLLSLIIGFFIFVLLIIGSINFLHNYKKSSTTEPKKTTVAMKQQTPKDEAMKEDTAMPKNSMKMYTVKDGDSLWTIAEQFYKSGYNAYDIAQKNNIADPNLLSAGQTLIIPDVQPKQQTVLAATQMQGQISSIATTEVTIKTNTYTVKTGDSLWTIAQQAYGDGNMWMRLAQANTIANPNVINAGTVLNIPRGQMAEMSDSSMTNETYK